MAKYAIIKLAGKQFQVQEKDEFLVDHLDTEPGKTFSTTEVLLINEDGKATIGNPHVAKAEVKIKVLENLKDKKIRVAKYKAKSRYRRVYGHRQNKSLVQIVSIS